jgi:hypothetical protein
MAKTHDELLAELLKALPENIAAALEIVASNYPDAQHHEHWVMDQVLRHVLGETVYGQFIEAYEAPRGEKGERWVENWDPGIAP